MATHVFLLMTLIYVHFVHCNEWAEPYFDDPQTVGVNFEKFAQNIQSISMEEELKVPIRLSIINFKENKPEIGAFQIGSSNLLNASIEEYEDKWVLVINSKQDYENPLQRIFNFPITCGKKSVQIMLQIKNIFDSKPTITYNGPCIAEELKADFDTNCVFTINDPDGLANNDITFDIVGNNNEKDYFIIKNCKKSDGYTLECILHVIKEMKYEQRTLYNFRTFVFDIAKNNNSISTIVEVEDVPNLDPVWVKPFATATFLEKEAQVFYVEAVDGDTGINKKINYKLEFKSDEKRYEHLITIDKEMGKLSIDEINRDELQQETFTFTICAYKFDNESWAIKSSAVIIVEDKNDNFPEIDMSPQKISFKEATYLNVPIERFIVNDIDLGVHATYKVTISQGGGDIKYSDAFDIIPTAGYQKTNFKLAILNATLLDYEHTDWKSFDLIFTAQEINFPERSTTFKLGVELINWNDEYPIFTKSFYNVSIKETIGVDKEIKTVFAEDRDVDDFVLHEIVGNIPDIGIEERTGVVFTTAPDAFDYERQRTVILQVKGTDTLRTYPGEPRNSAITQLTINVIDVNDETPEIRMPRISPNITENSDANTIVTKLIQAKDPDGDADLIFEIIWNESYATKSGKDAEKETYEDCFIIERVQESINVVYGHLKVNPEFKKYREIDYEMYEVIYLFIKVSDRNQIVNDNSTTGTLTIRVDDINDNAPEFIGDTLTQDRSIIEEALDETLVGTIIAIDKDGPGFNEVKYYMTPANLQTPDGLLQIDEKSGAITVTRGALIDCDIPKIYNLEYIIKITDTLNENENIIKIRVMDINNKVPKISKEPETIEKYENITTGENIAIIEAYDLDRDNPHNMLQYMINYAQFPELVKFFEIDLLTGLIRVKFQGIAKLDRDNGPDEYIIHVNIEDNYQGSGRSNTNKTYTILKLLDVNDNAPEIPNPHDFQPRIGENTPMHYMVGNELYAPDKDDRTTPNAQVSYRILSIEPEPDDERILDVSNYADIFTIETIQLQKGQIRTNKHLRGFYGIWNVCIEAYDHGDEWTSQLSLQSKETYQIKVEPDNFNPPSIIFPKAQSTLRLKFKGQKIGEPLIMTDNNILQSFEAVDDDGGLHGDITFEISSSLPNNDADYFKMIKETRKKSHLQITKSIEAKFYYLNIKVKDTNMTDQIENLKIVFVDLEGDPVFDVREFTTNFTENEFGLLELDRYIPEANDPKNEGIESEGDKFQTYYYIDEKFNPEDAKLFAVDNITRNLKVVTELDREKIDTHHIQIIATNQKDGIPTNFNDNSILRVEITVNDVNDNSPKFDSPNYGAGVTTSDYKNKPILTIHATDPDLNDTIRYILNVDDIETKGENIEEIKKTLFVLKEDAGALVLAKEIKNNMKGYFELLIIAYDGVNHSDTCSIKIYIVAESNRVTFVFLSTYNHVISNLDFLKTTFVNIYGYEVCNIDDVSESGEETSKEGGNDNDPNRISGLTNVRAHFIKNNEAIEASIIQSRSNDLSLMGKLKNALVKRSLILDDVSKNQADDVVQNMEDMLTTILIVVSVVLGTLCMVLVVAFFMRTRNLNRQLKAFSAPDFGSTESNLNRCGAPTTNVFSVEGSNPVLNNNDFQKDTYDTASVESFDSDFVGINNDPTFKVIDDVPESRNNSLLMNSNNNYLKQFKEEEEFPKTGRY